MSLQQSDKLHRRAPKDSDNSGRPRCQQCGRAMTLKQVSPLLNAAKTDEIVYGCEDCGTQAKRTVTRT